MPFANRYRGPCGPLTTSKLAGANQLHARTPLLRPKFGAMLVAPPLQNVPLHHAHIHCWRSTGRAAKRESIPTHPQTHTRTHTYPPVVNEIPRHLWEKLFASRPIACLATGQGNATIPPIHSRRQERVYVDCRYIERIQSCRDCQKRGKGSSTVRHARR